MSNFLNSTYTNVNDLVAINADSITCDTFLDQPSSYYTGLVSNIQSQINNINTAVSTNVPTFSIGTVTNLPSTSQPTVTKTGSSTSVILNFGLVKGADGPQGIQGIQGPQGAQGPKGDTGADGKDGSSAGTILGAFGLALGTLNALSTLALGIISTTEFAVITGEISTLQGEVSTLQSEVSIIQEKTAFLSSDGASQTTITSPLNIGPIGFIKTTISSATGEINTIGQIKVNNLITLGTSGDITGSSLSVGSGHIDAITTSNTSTQTIDGSTVNIGHAVLLPTPSLTTINMNGAVYVNGVLLQPFSAASSFFSQW